MGGRAGDMAAVAACERAAGQCCWHGHAIWLAIWRLAGMSILCAGVRRARGAAPLRRRVVFRGRTLCGRRLPAAAPPGSCRRRPSHPYPLASLPLPPSRSRATLTEECTPSPSSSPGAVPVACRACCAAQDAEHRGARVVDLAPHGQDHLPEEGACMCVCHDVRTDAHIHTHTHTYTHIRTHIHTLYTHA